MVNSITNKVFRVSDVTERFHHEYPNIPIIKAMATKLIQVDPQELTIVQRGEQWVHSMRGVIIITQDTLFCFTSPRFDRIHTAISQSNESQEFNDLIIPYETIQRAFLLEIQSGYVLALQMSNGLGYQFGLNRDSKLRQALPFPFETIQSNVGWSTYSIQARMRCLFYFIAIGLFIALIIAIS